MSEFTNKNIWVFIETDEGKTKSVGLELLNPGRMLAEKSGEKLGCRCILARTMRSN